MPGKRLPGCINCRKRHVRCDRKTPACSNCRNAKPPKECTFDALRIRQSAYSAVSEEESETPIPAIVTLRHRAPEGRRMADATSELGAHESMGPPVGLDVSPASHSALFSRICPPQHAAGYTGPTVPLSGDSPLSEPPLQHTPLDLSGSPRSQGSSRCGASVSLSSPRLPRHTSPCRLAGPHRNVTDPIEQMAFQFYVEHAGPWLDIVSSYRHFGSTVSRIALEQPVLYAACLAYASNVLCMRGKLAWEAYEQFHGEAIAALIPLLSLRYDPHMYEVLLATTVILRMSEQFSEISEDGLYHLNGANSLFAMTGDAWSPAHAGLKDTAFWIYLRESIRVCFLNEQACSFDLGIVNEQSETTNATLEETWTNRITYLVAQLCNACWGDAPPADRTLMRRRICAQLDEWRASLPENFEPWSFTHEQYQAFPSIKFLSPWHEIAWQKYYTAKVMLAVYGPGESDDHTIMGLSHYLNAEVITPARLACSVCFGSTNVGCAINGAHLISWCGQFFSGKEEQRVLAEYLKDFMDKTKWPNQTCCERLEQIWAGTRRTWSGTRD